MTVEKGTGLVHTAPGHGHDDFVIAINNGLKVVNKEMFVFPFSVW